MPYPNVPESKWDAMDRCVERVMADQDVTKARAVAICHTSIVGDNEERSVREAKCKRDGDVCRPAKDFLVVEDPDKPSTWHLPVTKTAGGSPDRDMCGAAWAALFSSGGHRGNRYEGPKAGAAKTKLRSIYEQQGWETPKQRTMLVPIPIREIDGHPGRFRAYAVRFTGPEERDAYGTYFDALTDFQLEYYNEWPWLHHHGRHKRVGPRKVGTWDRRGIDEQGLFVEGELDAHARYKEALETLIGEKVLFTSSQALSSMVHVSEDGHVDVWPIGEVSSTVTPADYRQEPISPAAMRAIELLDDSTRDGGIDMTDELTGKQKLLHGLGEMLGVTVNFDGEPKDTAGDDATPSEGDGERAAPDGGGEGRKTMTLDDVAERIAKKLELAKHREVMEQLDEALRDVTERLAKVEEIASQGAAESARAFMEGDEWYEKLFVASRDADVDPDDNDEPGAEAGRVGGVGQSVFAAIRDSQTAQ